MTRVRFRTITNGHLHIGARARHSSTGSTRKRPAASFCSALKTPICRPLRTNQPASIIEGMQWLGLAYDERSFFSRPTPTAHRAAANKLVAAGKHRDFTPKAERDDATVKQGIADRARAFRRRVDLRNNPYRDLPQAESDQRAAAGEPFAVPPENSARRQDSISQTSCTASGTRLFRDRGSGAAALRRPSLQPLGCDDDIEMGITHVIRGQDHLTNTHKQVLLYQALGAEVPLLHLPLILRRTRKLSNENTAKWFPDNLSRPWFCTGFRNFGAVRRRLTAKRFFPLASSSRSFLLNTSIALPPFSIFRKTMRAIGPTKRRCG